MRRIIIAALGWLAFCGAVSAQVDGQFSFNPGTSGRIALPVNTKFLYVDAASVPPSPLGDWNSITTAFTGNLNNLGIGISQSLTGTSVGTTGSPATGYQITRELAGIASYNYNGPGNGNNQSTSSNVGRTGVLNFYAKNDNYGQGDSISYFCDGFVSATRASATSFLASPEVGCLGGQLFANANGAYLEGIGDLNFKDSGFDASAFGLNFNFNRTNATGVINTNWIGASLQSTGTLPIDAMLRGTGPTRVALDFSALTFPDNSLKGTSINAAGTGYTVGDVLQCQSGTFDQPLTVKVLTLGASNAVATFGLDRAGLYSVSPPSPCAMVGGTGTGATFTVDFSATGNVPLMATKANACWYGNSTQNTGVFSTSFSSTLQLGTSYLCYQSSISGWDFVTANNSVLQLGQNLIIANQPTRLTSSIQSGGTAATLTGSCAHSTVTGGAIAGTFTATCTAQTIIIALPAAPNAWHCKASDLTTPTNTLNQTGALNTTAATLTGTTGVSDLIYFNCFGF